MRKLNGVLQAPSRSSMFTTVGCLTIMLATGSWSFGQTGQRRFTYRPDLPNDNVARNTSPAGKAEISTNPIIQPIPLSAREQEAALTAIDQHLSDEVGQLKTKIKDVLPDELGVLSKTTGWSQENQNGLVAALRSGDPTAVYEAWAKGSPQDTVGAEMIARQVEVKRSLARIDQDVQNKVAAGQDLSDLEKSLGKLSLASPVAADIGKTLDTLKTWVEVHKLIAAAIPDSGAIAKLPTGKVALIRDPHLPIGKAIVLSDAAVLVGNHRRGPVSITYGNAAEALGMPVVTSTPIPDAQGPQARSGVLLVDPKDSGGNVKYSLNGNNYQMEPGMSQRLPAGRWTIEYDRGGGRGTAAYELTDGTYYFTPTPDKGWQVYKQRFDIVLDNTDNPHDFNYVMNGEKFVVPASGTRNVGGIYPVVIKFDRGNGTVSTKAFNFRGTAQIGVNAQDNLWDVFPAERGQREPTNTPLFTQ